MSELRERLDIVDWRPGLYQREFTRYGGVRGVRAAEEIFCVDSAAVCRLLETEGNTPDPTRRWLHGVRLAAGTLDAVDATATEIAQLATHAIGKYDQALPLDWTRPARRRVHQLEKALSAELSDLTSSVCGLNVVAERNRQVGLLLEGVGGVLDLPNTGGLRPELLFARTLIHMLWNRLLLAHSLEQEYAGWLLLLFRAQRQTLGRK